MRSLYTALCSHPVLALLKYTKPFQIESGALETANDGVFRKSMHLKPIVFLIKILSFSVQNYTIYNCELPTIVTCCKALMGSKL